MEAVCRAITFISYHIPLTADVGKKIPQYSTLGFFDGMLTERLYINCAESDLKTLWRYTVQRTAESEGKFSYQNIFGFSEDSWNHCTDEEFWKDDSDLDYPLLLVVFLQLSDYMTGDNGIEQQCKKFNHILQENLGADGKYYTYGTIDKNDFVVCLRCKNHTQALNAIKQLHNTGSSVVYSYSVLSVSNQVLNSMNENAYPYLFNQVVDSICLKGITNSFRSEEAITLDQRYHEFSDKLIEKLYIAEEREEALKTQKCCVYDILGDDDFRLIARKVNLGRLLREFGPEGLLGNYQGELRFYLYSSSLVLNTLTKESLPIDTAVRERTVSKMDEDMTSPLCDQLSQCMAHIFDTLQDGAADERTVTFCQALWQLLQSLKVLESAPTKKYDFYSLYHPFAMLADIMEEKMKRNQRVNNAEIYDFIHKISMTLHGTLRTDIQFFQIRDFNVIVHYAPAKLRAFYALWALKISAFYNSFERADKKYSFILSPGVYGGTHVKQLFKDYREPERLMLITTPERNLYIPRWLSLIIAHEVSHFVGRRIRERRFRNGVLVRLSAHIAALEMQRFWYMGIYNLTISSGRLLRTTRLRRQLKHELVRVNDEICEDNSADPYIYHSDKSHKIIRKAYRNLGNNGIIERIISECGEMLRGEIRREAEALGKDSSDIGHIQDVCNRRETEMLLFFQRFQSDALPDILAILHYICTETFADIIALLTLGLSPTEYIMSFVRSEDMKGEQDRKQEWTGVLPVRIAVTIGALMTVVHKNASWLADYEPEFTKAWAGSVMEDTLANMEKNSDSYNIMLQAWGYKTHLTWKKNNIESYRGLYDSSYMNETFSNKDLDFLNDKTVYGLLCEYMNKCADTYFKQIRRDAALRNMRKTLLDTYQKLAQGSVIEMMQEVERFLQENEKTSPFPLQRD